MFELRGQCGIHCLSICFFLTYFPVKSNNLYFLNCEHLENKWEKTSNLFIFVFSICWFYAMWRSYSSWSYRPPVIILNSLDLLSCLLTGYSLQIQVLSASLQCLLASFSNAMVLFQTICIHNQLEPARFLFGSPLFQLLSTQSGLLVREPALVVSPASFSLHSFLFIAW